MTSLKDIKVFLTPEAKEIQKMQYETEGAAGIDIRSVEPTYVLYPSKRKIFTTGIFVEIPTDTKIDIIPRSGNSIKLGLGVLNSPGLIDSDYRGEIGVILINHSENPITVKKGDRIAQMTLTPVLKANIAYVESLAELSSTNRGDKGFGHTGVQ